MEPINEDEAVELVQQKPQPHHQLRHQRPAIVRIRPAVANRSKRIRLVGGCCLIVVILVAVVGSMRGDDDEPERAAQDHPLALLSCPAANLSWTNTKDIDERNKQISKDVSGFVKSFQTKSMAEWGGQTYAAAFDKLKARADWFSSLRNGDAIFENNCGIGINTVLTLDILREVHNVTNVTVYGSDASLQSIGMVNQLIEKGILPAHNSKGSFCQAESANLAFAPSNAFDLVFTAHLTDSNCDGSLKTKLSQYVKEMVRICKPGAPIVIQGLSADYCQNGKDGDAVSMEYWKESVKKHLWFVNPKSLLIKPNPVNSKNYDVLIKKFKKQTKQN